MKRMFNLINLYLIGESGLYKGAGISPAGSYQAWGKRLHFVKKTATSGSKSDKEEGIV